LIEMPVDGRAPDASVIEHKWNLFLELVRWIDGGACRHDAILRYFGADDAELEGCGHCDMCESVEAAALDQDAITIVRKALSGVARVHGRFGFNAAVLLLRGVSDDRLERAGLSRVTTFGALADEPEPFVVRLIRRCIGAGWVAFTASERPLLLLTAEGRDVMIGRKPVRLALPPRTAPQPSRGPRAPKKPPHAADDLDASGRRLFDALRAHRLERARVNGVPPYVVASDRTLREIASLKPSSSAELMAVHGIGAHKAERFGAGLLAVVARHAEVQSG
jgi:ATP-dependent DNA helicase RecQ